MAAFGCAGLPVAETPDASRCLPVFPYQDGWLGADAAYSIPLGGHESLWLFGDTFVGRPEATDRRGAAFIHNSVGLARCERGVWSIAYHWGEDEDGPADFIDRGEPGAWWWLFDGFLEDDALYLGLLRVESHAPRGPLAMPFAFSGVDLARIENPRDPIDAWRIERVPLSRHEGAFPAGAMVVEGDHVYFFTFLDPGSGRHPRMLTRIPRSALREGRSDLEPVLERLATDGTWKAGLDPSDARILMDDDATEMSVDRHPGVDGWLALYSYPSLERGFPAERPEDRVWVRTAPSLEGPWSERRSLFRVPELDPAYAGGYDAHTACYAAKAHPQLFRRTAVTFTYVCNLFAGPETDPIQVLLRLADDMGLYRPIPVSVTLPPELLAPGAAAP